eukprot:scaffold95764_cov32-Prasinocladus_malaysianus.AAC.1
MRARSKASLSAMPGNQIGYKEVKALAGALPQCILLQHLNLTSESLSRVFSYAAWVLGHGKLIGVELDRGWAGNLIGPEEVKVLAGPLSQCSSLEYLDLGCKTPPCNNG